MDLQTLRDNIDTIFIVMLENRSFDHVLGARFGIPAITNPSSRDASRAFDPLQVRDQWIDTDLPHGRDRIATAMSGDMTGFVQAYEDEIDAPAPEKYCPPMWHIDPQDLPVTNFLARTYRTCTRWHAALPCDTFPNRLMAMSGTALIDDTAGIDPVGGKWLPDQYTVLEWAHDHIKDRPPFEIYVDCKPVPGIGYPTTFYLMKRLHPFLFNNEYHLDSLKTRISQWDRTSPNPQLRPPALVYCEPFFNDLAIKIPLVDLHGSCNHPPLPMAYGESFLARVYDAVRSRPDVWARSLLIVVYDEHGGFFDHVQPPAMHYSIPPGANWTIPEPIETLGLRVPAIVISPWARADDTPEKPEDDTILDHTSILQLVVERFGVPADLGRFGHALTRSSLVKSVREVLASTANTADAPPAPPAPPVPPRPPTHGSHEFTSAIAELWAAHLKD